MESIQDDGQGRDTPDRPQRARGIGADGVVATCLGQKAALEHGSKTSGKNQIVFMFCACVTEVILHSRSIRHLKL